MKNAYTTPLAEVTLLDEKDVLTSSPGSVTPPEGTVTPPVDEGDGKWNW